MDIDAVILAGGLSTRMKANKSLVKLNGKKLIDHVYERVSPQVNKVWISTNEIIKGYPSDVQFPDDIQEKIGPLSGIYSGLKIVRTDWVQFCPTDCPSLPENLVDKLSSGIGKEGFNIFIPLVHGNLQPTFMLCHRSVRKSIDPFITSKNYKLMSWVKSNHYKEIIFHDEVGFANINDQEELKNYQDEA
mgnify:FL=1